MKPSDLYLIHILDCVNRIAQYTEPGKDAFDRSSLIQDGVLRNLEIIGEATKQLDHSFRDAHSQIPWRKMAGLRDVLIHNYPGVDLELVWQITPKA